MRISRTIGAAALLGSLLVFGMGSPASAAPFEDGTYSNSCRTSPEPGVPDASAFVSGAFASIEFTFPAVAGGPMKVVLRGVDQNYDPAHTDGDPDVGAALMLDDDSGQMNDVQATTSFAAAGPGLVDVTFSWAATPATPACLQMTQFHTDMAWTYWSTPFVVLGAAMVPEAVTFVGAGDWLWFR